MIILIKTLDYESKTNNMETIYKKDSKGKVRYLSITTEGNLLVQTSGVLDTPNPVVNKSVCEPKNVGKANATTAEEQAISEAQSKITEKMRQGYFKTIEEAQAEGGQDFLLPMLAKDYKKEKSKVKMPCYVQPKLDGMRSLKKKQTIISRTGKEVDTMPHIAAEMNHIEDVFDGELYAHGLSFQDNMRLIKKYRKGESEKVKYHVYDMVLPLPFSERYALLKSLTENSENFELVPTYLVTTEDELKDYHKSFIEQGYEGTIVRHGDSGYDVNKRSSSLLKYKDFIDQTYTIIDVVPSESRPEQGVIHCKGVDNSGHEITFGCGMKFSHAEREEILKNKEEYIGKTAEVRFFEFSEDGVPRFPVCVGVRLDK